MSRRAVQRVLSRAFPRRRLAASLILVLLSALVSGQAHAQGPRPTRPELNQVRQTYERAIALMKHEAWAEGAALLEASELRGFKNVLWNLAECYQRLGRPAAAVEVLEHFVRHPRATADDAAQARTLIDQFRRRTAQVSIETSPAGAIVLVDGRERGRGPLKLELDPGSRLVLVEAPGHRAERFEVGLKAGDRQTMRAVLRLNPGEVTVVSRPPGAEVLIGGTPAGHAPLTRAVPPGGVIVEARLPGHQRVLRQMQVASGERVRLELGLRPLQATVSVVTNVTGARVSIDGRVVGQTPLAPLQLAPGRALLSVEKTGHQAWGGELATSDRDQATVTVRLSRGRLPARWFIAATAVGVLGLSAAGGLLALSRNDGAEYGSIHSALVGRLVPPSMIGAAKARAMSLAGSQDRHFNQATALFIGGGIALVTAATVAVFTRWRRSEGRVAITGSAP
jgi:hypothetical protein